MQLTSSFGAFDRQVLPGSRTSQLLCGAALPESADAEQAGSRLAHKSTGNSEKRPNTRFAFANIFFLSPCVIAAGLVDSNSGMILNEGGEG